MLSCPSCHAGALRRSRARNRREAAIMQLTPFRYFRCHDCSTRVLQSWQRKSVSYTHLTLPTKA